MVTPQGIIIDWSSLGWVAMALLNAGLIWGGAQYWKSKVDSALAEMKREIASVRQTVEGHAVKAEKIGPIESELESLKSQINNEFKNVREDIRELARSVHGFTQLFLQGRSPLRDTG